MGVQCVDHRFTLCYDGNIDIIFLNTSSTKTNIFWGSVSMFASPLQLFASIEKKYYNTNNIIIIYNFLNIEKKMANIGRRYSWTIDKYAQRVEYPPTPREYQELCSISDKDNSELPKNTLSPTVIISKGFFQTAAQKALQNSRIDEAFQIAEQYIEMSKRKFYRFLDVETKKIIISKQLNRFDAGYIITAKQKLKGLQNIGLGHSIMHITLTVSHTENTDYIKQYQRIKTKFEVFMYFFRRLMKKKVDYVSTYEVTQADDGRFHQHIHVIVIDQSYLPKKIIYLLSAKWKKITGSQYIHFKYISKNRNINIFSYVMKYITKEFSNINLTTVLLFSVKGKAYTMSQRLSQLLSEKTIDIAEKKYKYIDSFEAQDIFYGYAISDYDPASITFFFSFLSAEEKTKLLSEARPQAEARQKTQKEEEEADKRDMVVEEKNSVKNIIKIK